MSKLGTFDLVLLTVNAGISAFFMVNAFGHLVFFEPTIENLLRGIGLALMAIASLIWSAFLLLTKVRP